MKMTGLRLRAGASTINLPLHGALPSDQFILKGVEGLGPVGRDVAIARGVHRRTELQDREITALVGLGPNWSTGQTAGHLRDILYGLLLVPDINSDIITIEIMDGATVVAKTTGVVRQIEPAIFTKDPAVQVVIPCLDSYFEGTTEHLQSLNANATTALINNIGTVPVGFRFSAYLAAGASSFSIWSGDSANLANSKNKLTIEQGVGIDDEIIIDTRPGKREITMIRPYIMDEQGTSYMTVNLLDKMSADSVWPVLPPGEKNFYMNVAVQSPGGSVRHTPRFWGV